MSFNPSQVQFTPVTRSSATRNTSFQSLTGSIHTGGRGEIAYLIIPFQSLTGSIHTIRRDRWNCLEHLRFNPSQVQFTRNLIGCSEYDNSMFQSLTGSIHTLRVADDLVTAAGVSIPHRFNSHEVGIDPDFYEDIMFQSLTGSIHTKNCKF